jgi:hypothetical protein
VLPSFLRPVTSRPMPMMRFLPVGQIARDVLVVFLVIRRRHQHVDVLPHHFVLGITNEPFRPRIERLDSSTGVDDDDARRRPTRKSLPGCRAFRRDSDGRWA